MELGNIVFILLVLKTILFTISRLMQVSTLKVKCDRHLLDVKYCNKDSRSSHINKSVSLTQTLQNDGFKRPEDAKVYVKQVHVAAKQKYDKTYISEFQISIKVK